MTFLANKDRHLGNFGVIRNLDTLKWDLFVQCLIQEDV